jgi:hypothetical protein
LAPIPGIANSSSGCIGKKIWKTKKEQNVSDKRIDFRAILIERTRLQFVSLFLELQTKICEKREIVAQKIEKRSTTDKKDKIKG